MKNRNKFLMLIAFLSHFIVENITENIEAPFTIIRHSMNIKVDGYNISFNYESLGTILIHIIGLWFMIIALKAVRDRGKVNPIKMLLNLTGVMIVFFIVDGIRWYIQAMLFSVFYSINAYYFITNVIMGLGILLCLITMIDNGVFTLTALFKIFKLEGYRSRIIVATILLMVPQAIPHVAEFIFLYLDFVMPLILSIAFCVLVKPVLVTKTDIKVQV